MSTTPEYEEQMGYCVENTKNPPNAPSANIDELATGKTERISPLILKRYKQAIIYGFALAFLLFMLRFLELRFLIFRHSFELYAGLIAAIFTALGIWLTIKLGRHRLETVVVEKEVYRSGAETFIPDAACISQLSISKRELEILELMARGYSNQEIADCIFVSLSTVKTHNQNLFSKLGVMRRTQAIDRARQLNIIQ